MRTKLVAGNWKMNNTTAQAAALVKSFSERVVSRNDVDIVVCPAFVSLCRVKELLKDSYIHIGAQDCFWEESGAFTGKVSVPMLVDAGVSHCIVGHSETRGKFGKLETPESTIPYFHETDETVNLKLKSLLFHALVPILCVGETASERDAGKTDEIIQSQLSKALAGFDSAELYFLVIAYEPVWAIGTGQTCDSAEANRVCGMIRSFLAQKFDKEVADEIRILYGGSVKASNAKELFSQPEIDGGLVGGASLDAEEFSKIVIAA